MNNKLSLFLARNYSLQRCASKKSGPHSAQSEWELSARLLSFPIPEVYPYTLRISQGQVTKQLTKITAKTNNKPISNPIKAKIFRQKQGFFETTLVFGPKSDCTKKLFYAKRTQFVL